MAVRSYELIGHLQSVQEFRNYLYTRMLENNDLELDARETGNELATRRHQVSRRFNITVHDIHRDLGIIIGRDTPTGALVQIQVDDPIVLIVNE